ncbi:MAG: UDP-N-acetylmuramoyl-L-alanyl-D-glutamate--2,6-diaminopimelate ligase [Thermodesulfobacteriota bacterium]|nr:UDP-N-acetylmuramoyl-L-alanyl-D-glutamate--2,6-diaminopimelate ligase [Thermodesulfobacteriota bacterium]
MNLAELLVDLDYKTATDLAGIEISGITSDSREVKPGTIFVAVEGLTVDGHCFVENAVKAGCSAIVVRKSFHVSGTEGKPVKIEVPDTRVALSQIATAFFGHPADELILVGITGTNGKTTTTYMVESVVRQAGGTPGVIGTVNYRYNNVELPAPFSTPEAVLLHQVLRQMADSGVTHVIMEVSSHALVQERLHGLLFDVALFTNLSRDHLDFHGSMAAYFEGKKKLFYEHLKKDGRAVVVTESGVTGSDVTGDDGSLDWGRKLIDELLLSHGFKADMRQRNLLTCGLNGKIVHPVRFRYDLSGIDAEISTPQGNFHLKTPLIGEFNLKNLLGATGVGLALGFDIKKIKKGLQSVKKVPGRLERVETKRDVKVFVDYAHTPDALLNVLSALKKLGPERLIVIFGCGGDRDRGKRPLMGKVAAGLADGLLLTSDNPRSEEPEKILADIEQGVKATGRIRRMRAELFLGGQGLHGYDVIVSRREAIGTAIRYSRSGDVVLICGKGHERYQITREGKRFFCDRLEAVNQLKSN